MAVPRVQYLNHGRSISLKDRTLAYDGMHLTRAGNEIIAGHLFPVLKDSIR